MSRPWNSTPARLAATLATLAASLMLTAAAPAAEPTTVGDRIDVYAGTPTTFSAGEPFHISHGWGIGALDAPEQAGLWDFRLEVDGVVRPADIVRRSTDAPPTTAYESPLLTWVWIFNFPAGMRGTHTFTGHWVGPCRLAVQGGTYSEPCPRPNAPVDVLVRTLTVDFQRQNLALGRPVTASNEYLGYPSAPALAVDGDWYTYWNSGNHPPQWIEVDLGSVRTVGEIDLGITQLPDCFTVHRLYGRSSTSDPWTLLREFSGFTVDQQHLTYTAGLPQQTRYVRVETTTSLSWVAWREIAVYGP